MNPRLVRRALIGVLVAEFMTGLVVALAAAAGSDPGPQYRAPVVVESRCIDGHVDQSIDDGNPAGLLAYDTGVAC